MAQKIAVIRNVLPLNFPTFPKMSPTLKTGNSFQAKSRQNVLLMKSRGMYHCTNFKPEVSVEGD